MKAVLFVCAVICAGICQAAVRPAVRVVKLERDDKLSRLQSNRIPKNFVVNNELDTDDSSSESEEQIQAIESSNVDVCAECKVLASKLKEALDNPQKLAELEAELKILCDFLSGEYQTACRNIADDLPFVLHQLEPYLGDPAVLCQKLRLCSASRLLRSLQNLAYLKLRQKYTEVTGRQTGEETTTPNSLPCDECIFAVNELKAELEDPQTQADVKQALDNICSRFGSLQQQCIDVVNNLVPQLFSQMEQLLADPNGVCKQMGLCQSTEPELMLEIRASSLLAARKLESLGSSLQLQRFVDGRMQTLRMLRNLFARIRTSNGNRIECVMCEYGVREIVDYLEQNSTLDEMLNAMRSMCSLVPEQTQQQCYDLLSQYGRTALITAIDQLQPQQVCRDLHYCSAQEFRELVALPSDVRKTMECEACSSFVDLLRYEFQQPALKRELKLLLSDLCDYAPQSLQSECESLSDQYVDELVNIMANLKADQVCPIIRMCPKSPLSDILSPEDTLQQI